MFIVIIIRHKQKLVTMCETWAWVRNCHGPRCVRSISLYQRRSAWKIQTNRSQPHATAILVQYSINNLTVKPNQPYIAFLSFALQELRLGYGSLNFQQALKHCSAKTIFMYLQAHLNFMCTFDSDMKFSLDFWQTHNKIYFPLLRSTKMCLIHSFVSRVMYYLYYFSLTRVLISFISMV